MNCPICKERMALDWSATPYPPKFRIENWICLDEECETIEIQVKMKV